MSILRRLSHPFMYWRIPPRSDDLRPNIKDNIFHWQLGSADFNRLDEDTILRAEICGKNKSYAVKILKACYKSGIIDSGSGQPQTHKIDRSMVKTMPVISAEKQRELVMLLFFWEEESTRWRLLNSETDEIRQKLAEEGLSDSYRIELGETLKILEARKRVLPSLRDQSGRVMCMDDEQLPTYDEARRARSS